MIDIMLAETIASRIYLIRCIKVIFDRDLAELYEVETAQLKRAVRQNIDRFPDDFMFELTKRELDNWRCQFGTSNRDKMGLRHKPMVAEKPPDEDPVELIREVLSIEKKITKGLKKLLQEIEE